MDLNTTAMAANITEPSGYDSLTCDGQQSISTHQLLEIIATGSAGFQAKMFMPIPLLVVMFAMFVDEVVFITKDVSDWRRVTYLIWVVSSFPFLALLCVIQLFMPRTTAVTTFAITFYFAIILKKFFMLVLSYYGGRHRMEIALRGEAVVSANPFPCCFVCCCYKKPMTVPRINILQGFVYQVIIVYPLAYFIMTLFAAEGLRSRAAGVSLLFVELLAAISSFVALYGYVVLTKGSNYALQQFHIRGKFLCVQPVILFNTVQGFVIRNVGRFIGLPCGYIYPDKENADLLHSYIFFYELFFLAVGAWFMYKKSEQDAEVVIREEPPSYYNRASDDIDVEKVSMEESSLDNNGLNTNQANEKQDHDLPKIEQRIV